MFKHSTILQQCKSAIESESRIGPNKTWINMNREEQTVWDYPQIIAIDVLWDLGDADHTKPVFDLPVY
jgi:hypothetical protein